MPKGPQRRWRHRFFSDKPSIIWEGWTAPRRSILVAIFTLCLLASFFDGWSTLLFVAAGGEEANVLLAPIFTTGALASWLIWWIKLFCVPLLLYALMRRCATHPLAWIMYCVAACIHVGLTVMHLALTHRLI